MESRHSRLTGSWGFCSGSDFSEWLIFNAPAGPDGEGHMFLVPREDTTTIDDWFPTGMRGTGSRAMAVDDVFVPDALRSVQRIYSLVGAKAGNPAHPVSLAKRDIEMVSHHVTLNWRQSAVRYLNAAVLS